MKIKWFILKSKIKKAFRKILFDKKSFTDNYEDI